MPQINFRVDTETWFFLHTKKNYSDYLRDLIIMDRQKEGDTDCIKIRLDTLKKEIQGLEEIQKRSTIIKDNRDKILKDAGSVFKEMNRGSLPDHANILWIKSRVIPKLKENKINGTYIVGVCTSICVMETAGSLS